MCGRVRLANEWSEIRIRLKFDPASPAPNIAASWNIPPTGTLLTAIRSEDGRRVPEKMRFGLIPAWAKDTKMAFSTFNARAESLSEKPAFREAWRKGRRCLVVADGFYEWRKSDRRPFAIGMAVDGLMTMAGLWDEWRDPLTKEKLRSCTIITCEPNELMATLHDRMPVILDEKDWPKWLGEEPASDAELKALLVPCPWDRIKMWPVDKRVGNVRNDGPDLARPLEPLLL
jgi:putative SOS response-associated peptidase YedK